MTLAPSILPNLKRLGAVLPKRATGSAVHVLIRSVIWPDIVFMPSTQLMREYLRGHGSSNVDEWSEETIQDHFPMLYQLRFLQPNSRGRFWNGWEQSFPAVDSASQVPFATDDYYFYFLAENPKDATDPLVLGVDHEETNLEPHQRRELTVGQLLSIIVPIDASKAGAKA